MSTTSSARNGETLAVSVAGREKNKGDDDYAHYSSNEDERERHSRHRHKHHKSKKKRKHRSGSRSRSRKEHKHHKKSKSKRSHSSDSNSSGKEVVHDPSISLEDLPQGKVDPDLDDLPMGADFRTLLDESRAQTSSTSVVPLDLSSLPCDPMCSKKVDTVEHFPLSKERSKKDDDEDPPVVTEKKPVQNRVGDFVPRNVKVKQDAKKSSAAIGSSNSKENIAEFGPCPPTEDEWVADELDRALDEARNPKKPEEKPSLPVDDEEWSSCSTITGRRIHRTGKNIKKKKEKRRSRSRSRERSKSKRSNGRSKRSGSRSRRRSKSPRRHSKERSSRSRRSRSKDKRSRSRSPRKSRKRSRSRSNSREKIDKEKLLAIAKKQAGRYKEGIIEPKSIDDFVSYCEKIQKKQIKEDRRERGEIVSDDSEPEEAVAFKHPYGVKPAEPIKFNIFTTPPPPTDTPQTCFLETKQLRITFPVSSGVVHKEKSESEWKPVEKEPVPVTCSVVQKKNVAPTSLEIMRKSASNPVLPTVPSIGPSLAPIIALPPPPAPPSFNRNGMLLPPPPLPPMLVVPPVNDIILQEPAAEAAEDTRNMRSIMTERAKAQARLTKNPNDFEAYRILEETGREMSSWASIQSAPGKFTGSTGIHVLSQDELQPMDPRFHAWIKKDMFKNLPPAKIGLGKRLLEKMGWKDGTGLGKEGTGSLEPLVLDIKNDRKGLATVNDRKTPLAPNVAKNVRIAAATEKAGKHPTSLLMELCAKRKWSAPVFRCQEFGPPNQKEFYFSVIVNGIEYQTSAPAKTKKEGKTDVSHVVLQSMGLIPGGC